ncbi:hypothetical protein DSO57_1003603 [Entomophthora muscae]|uniref:Uncharacterized protein n=1 Tax=Entomophthora muscae TaxID=34485 RepID=A0ACC2TVG4_9FUNG|nr:hypothetical protein DSO57_1003603 [Entomophthora muscae]
MTSASVTLNQLQESLRSGLNASHVEVVDTSGGCGQSFDVIVVSEAFEGINRLQRHRMVNEAAKDEIAKLHAFSQKTFTPTQWAEHSIKKSKD